jgi:hypothetical protein
MDDHPVINITKKGWGGGGGGEPQKYPKFYLMLW